MDGLSDSMFVVSIQWLKIPMDGLSDSNVRLLDILE